MSTNKRKEAAALFELIDKSTLKVPKHAGALKIPSWWSSKTNPAPPPTPPEEIPTAPPLHNGSPTETPTPAAQHRLFEPPPANAKSTLSPSIRAPAPTPSTPPPGQPPVRVFTTPQSTPSADPTNHNHTIHLRNAQPKTCCVFAPHTFDPASLARRQWMGQQKRRVARIPPWAIFTGAAAVLLLLALIIFLILHGRHKPVPTFPTGVDLRSSKAGTFSLQNGASQPPTLGDTRTQQSLLPPKYIPPAPTPTDTDTDTGATDTAESGKVFGPGTVDRDPKLYYIVIASTPSASIAQKNADFLANHGIDVSIEKRNSPTGHTGLFTLISVKGFPTITEAEAYKKKIVLVGHQHPDFVKYRKVWDDAYAAHINPPAKAGTAK